MAAEFGLYAPDAQSFGREANRQDEADLYDPVPGVRGRDRSGNADRCVRVLLRVPTVRPAAPTEGRGLLRLLLLRISSVSTSATGKALLLSEA